MQTDLLERQLVVSKPGNCTGRLMKLLCRELSLGDIIDCLLPPRFEGAGGNAEIIASFIRSTMAASGATQASGADWAAVPCVIVAIAAGTAANLNDAPFENGAEVVSAIERSGLRFIARRGKRLEVGVLLPDDAVDLGALAPGRVLRLA